MITLHRIFVGPQGIRAGWSVAIFVALLVAADFAVRVAMAHFHVPQSGPVDPKVEVIAKAGAVALIVAATAIMGWIEGKPSWSYGLGGGRPVANFLFGFLGGVLCLSALVALLNARGYLAFDGLALHGSQILEYGALWLGAGVLIGVTEEATIRGYLQSALTRGMGFWPAAAITSLIFAALHLANTGETALGIAAVFAGGMAFCLMLRVSGSLWLGIGFHAAWDWAESFIYGAPDSGFVVRGHLLITHAVGDPRMSGGTDGPEGSLLAQPVLLAGVLLLVLIYRLGSLPARPSSSA